MAWTWLMTARTNWHVSQITVTGKWLFSVVTFLKQRAEYSVGVRTYPGTFFPV